MPTAALVLALLAASTSPQTAPSSPPAPVATLTAAEAAALAREIAPRVEALRGLKFRSEVPVKIVGDEVSRAHFMDRARRFWPEERVRVEQAAYAQIGLLPAGTRLLDEVFRILEEQVGGFYDPEKDALFLLDDMPRSGAPIILAHELTHALDDQHFAIDAMIEEAAEDEDRGTAIGAVVEGSGTLIMMAFVASEVAAGRMTMDGLLEMQKSEAGRAEVLNASPQFLQRGLLASYLLGQSFLQRGNTLALMAGVKAEDINQAFRDPPLSAEQILHPEKYWNAQARDLPRPITLPDLSAHLGPKWSREGSGRLGEMNLAILAGAPDIGAETLDASRWTNAAASGWGGDLWHLYRRDSSTVTVLATVWDTPEDAGEFEAALAALPGRKVHRAGQWVVLVAGAEPAAADAAAAAALEWLGREPDAADQPSGARPDRRHD